MYNKTNDDVMCNNAWDIAINCQIIIFEFKRVCYYGVKLYIILFVTS